MEEVGERRREVKNLHTHTHTQKKGQTHTYITHSQLLFGSQDVSLHKIEGRGGGGGRNVYVRIYTYTDIYIHPARKEESEGPACSM